MTEGIAAACDFGAAHTCLMLDPSAERIFEMAIRGLALTTGRGDYGIVESSALILGISPPYSAGDALARKVSQQARARPLSPIFL